MFIPGVSSEGDRTTVEARAHNHAHRVIEALQAQAIRKAA
jgi:hypothetical protein